MEAQTLGGMLEKRKKKAWSSLRQQQMPNSPSRFPRPSYREEFRKSESVNCVSLRASDTCWVSDPRCFSFFSFFPLGIFLSLFFLDQFNSVFDGAVSSLLSREFAFFFRDLALRPCFVLLSAASAHYGLSILRAPRGERRRSFRFRLFQFFFSSESPNMDGTLTKAPNFSSRLSKHGTIM